MEEKVIIRQNNKLETEIIPDFLRPPSGEFQLVGYRYALTPSMLLLASLGACTAGVLHAYAKNHELDLHEVEIHLHYEPAAKGDGQDSETDNKYHNRILQEVKLIGNLEPEMEKRIFLICRRCAIHSILEHGIQIQSDLIRNS